MEQSKKLKVFISYSHKDTSYVDRFRTHISPLKDNGLIEDWYDRKILPGEDFEEKIDNNLEDADVICLFISADFFDSDNCKKEKMKAFKLKKSKGIPVIPIILSDCGWEDVKDISKPLVLPTDGKPISNFPNQDSGWKDVYDGLKEVIQNEFKIRQLQITNDFNSFLNNAEMLSKAHSQKETVNLDDIFIYPEVDKYDELKEYDKTISSNEIINNLSEYQKIVLAGEDQSGKTSLCKKFFIELRKMNFIPIYISGKNNQLLGKMERIITRSYNKQYEGVRIEEIDKKRIVPIIDDFHYAKYKEKQIKDLSGYQYTIIIVDDIYCLNIKDEKLLHTYVHFKIKELKPSIRDKLIRKWITLSDKEDGALYNDNDLYQNIDKATELIQTSLGKVIGSGIMPSYPFFILIMVSTYETLAKPLDQEITSQGYCYQALLYLYLRKQGVKNEDIDTYINFLMEFAFYIYEKQKNELSKDEFDQFMRQYSEKYNLPIKQETLVKKLSRVQILYIDSLNNYSFKYFYIYYFFVGKYLADHIEDQKDTINKIFKNLHINENAYISIFISHHSRNPLIIRGLTEKAQQLFNEYPPATLTKNELDFFDKQSEYIVEAVLPPGDISPENERERRLKLQDKMEELKKDHEQKEEIKLEEIEIRRAIKTVEVLGRIIKNRAGSLEKEKLEEIFNEAMNVHLRFVSLFFEIIKNEDQQEEIISIISERLKHIIENKEELSRDELKKIAENIFWNINFFTVYGIINMVVHSLGSDKLTKVIEKICEKEDNPAINLVKHGILMWYHKNVQTERIAKLLSNSNYSEISKRILKFMIMEHCSVHSVKYRERQRIETKIGIPSKKLLRAGKKHRR